MRYDKQGVVVGISSQVARQLNALQDYRKLKTGHIHAQADVLYTALADSSVVEQDVQLFEPLDVMEPATATASYKRAVQQDVTDDFTL